LLTGAEKDVLELRERIITLRNLVDAGTILRMHGATLKHLDLMEVIEKELGDIKTQEEENG